MASTEMDRARLGEIGRILGEWLREGDEGKGGVPAHPELVYRQSGEWRGWNTLLSVDTARYPAEAAENRRQDELEEQAWIVWKAMHE